MRLYEGQNRFDIVYGVVPDSGSSATVGVQNTAGNLFTQFECNSGGLSSGLQLIFTLPICGTATITPTADRANGDAHGDARRRHRHPRRLDSDPRLHALGG